MESTGNNNQFPRLNSQQSVNKLTSPNSLQASFKSAANALSSFYKDAMNSNQEYLSRGRMEAYQDMLNWMLNQNMGDLKHIPISSFMNFLQDRLKKCEAEGATPLENEPPEQWKINLSGLKIHDSKKRLLPKNLYHEENFEVYMDDQNNRKFYSIKRKKN